MNSTTYRFDACRHSNASGQIIRFDGLWETGEAQAGEYEYAIFGDGKQPAQITYEPSGAIARLSFRGLSESRLTSHQYDERVILRTTFDYSAGSSYVADFGTTGDPFIEIDGGGSYTVNGPYRYRTSECVGGSLRIATLQPFSFAGHSYPTGGQLRFSSGNDAATVTIQSNNGAIISFADGRSDSISPEEMREMFDSFATECVLIPDSS